MTATIQKGYRAGAIGRIAQLHATYYSASNGFGVEFEAKVANELGKFCESYKPGRDGLWLAVDREIEGSIAIDGSNANNEGAHLRWLITSGSLQGQGMGRQLLSRAIQFVDACKYKQVYLWTFNGLSAARHLYESYGFRLAHESIGSRWGTPVSEQKFVREVWCLVRSKVGKTAVRAVANYVCADLYSASPLSARTSARDIASLADEP